MHSTASLHPAGANSPLSFINTGLTETFTRHRLLTDYGLVPCNGVAHLLLPRSAVNRLYTNGMSHAADPPQTQAIINYNADGAGAGTETLPTDGR